MRKGHVCHRTSQVLALCVGGYYELGEDTMRVDFDTPTSSLATTWIISRVRFFQDVPFRVEIFLIASAYVEGITTNRKAPPARQALLGTFQSSTDEKKTQLTAGESAELRI